MGGGGHVGTSSLLDVEDMAARWSSPDEVSRKLSRATAAELFGMLLANATERSMLSSSLESELR